MKKTILWKYIFYIIGLALMSSLLLQILTYTKLKQELEKQLSQRENMMLINTREKVDNSIDSLTQTLTQISMNYATFHESEYDFKKLSTENIYKILDYNNDMLIPNNNIKNFYLYYPRNERLIVNTRYMYWEWFKDRSWLYKYLEWYGEGRTDIFTLTRNIPTNAHLSENLNYTQGISLIRSFPILSKNPIGYVVVNAEASSLISPHKPVSNSKFIVLDTSGNLVYGETVEKSLLNSITNGNKRIKVNNEYKLIFTEESKKSDWIFIDIVSEKELYQPLTPVIHKVLLTVLVSIFIIIILGLITSRLLYKPINDLVITMHQLFKTDSKEKNNTSKNELQLIKEGYLENISLNFKLSKQIEDQKEGNNRDMLFRLLKNELIIKENMPLIDSNKLCVILVDIDLINKKDNSKIWTKIVNKAESAFVQYSLEYLHTRINMGVFIIGYTDKTYQNLIDDITNRCQIIAHEIKNEEKTNIVFAIGQSVDTIKDIHISYFSTLEIIKYRFYASKSVLIHSELKTKQGEPIYPSKLQENLIDSIKKKIKKDSKKNINDLCEYMTNKNIPPEHARSWLNSIWDILVFLPTDMGYDIQSFYSPNNIPINLDHSLTLNDIEHRMLDLCDDIISKFNIKQKNQVNELINSICTYIINHISEDISLDKIAELFHLSAGYLSTLFKQETGTNFGKFVLKARMDLSLELISETKMSIKDISAAIGYTNDRSFYTAFKKTHGITPSQYRKIIKKKAL